MTLQFLACVVATFTIIFLLGCFCMSWQIFIGYRNIIRSAHNRPHKAPCHTVVGRRMRLRLDPAYSFCAPRTRACILWEVEKMKILIYLSNSKYVTDKRKIINHYTRRTKFLLDMREKIGFRGNAVVVNQLLLWQVWRGYLFAYP